MLVLFVDSLYRYKNYLSRVHCTSLVDLVADLSSQPLVAAAFCHSLADPTSVPTPARSGSASDSLHDRSRLLFTTLSPTAIMSATHTDTHEPQIFLMSDSHRPSSIDLSLELERELDAESLPNSPNPPRPQSLDTNVLASIVTQLRLSLAETTKERDTLAEKLAEAQTREEGMRETLEHVTDKCIRMENDLELAANQRKEDEETIAMLRSKVEESRCVSLPLHVQPLPEIDLCVRRVR